MIKFLKKDPYVFIVLLIALMAGWWLLRPGYFNMHDDLQMMRQLAMEKCFADFQIPCRWTQYMGYGYGFPLFNFYPPLPYLVGEGIRIFQFSFVTTVKLTFLLSFLISGVTMYIFAREFFGRLGGLLSAAFYIWAPYHSVDIYVRGAMNEAWSLVWFPLILWASYRLIKSGLVTGGTGGGSPTERPQPLLGARTSGGTSPGQDPLRWILVLALAWFGLLTSHNLMVLIFTPLFLAWLSIWILKYKAWRSVPNLAISGAWAFGLAAFFTLPVFLEQKLVHVETLTQGYYEYVAHFANIRQLLTSRFWGYGPSAWADADDKMAFPVGQIHWILASVVVSFLGWTLLKRRKINNESILVTMFFFLSAWFATFMVHVKSTFIWQQIPPLLFVQFPWRFLTLAVLSFSIVVGVSAVLLTQTYPKIAKWVVFGLIAGVVGWNWQFFKPERMGPLTDQEKFSGAAWDLQQTAGIYDYLPKDASTAPKAPQRSVADIVSGKGQISDASQGSNWAKFKVTQDEDDGKVRINIFQFPGWKVSVDGREVEVSTDKDEWGRMYIDVPKGEHSVTVRLYNTQARTAGNVISLISWGGILALGASTFKRKKHE
ncbi:MAG: hypothetical protein HY376_00520 [Candidatus Blackburnbacteria bacterium]|nr:hypothetical protein [Candidatus Blackburnbacteria bacterium]